MTDRAVKDAMRRFQREMQKLGLGVTMQIGDEEPVVICEAPDGDQPGTSSTAERPHPKPVVAGAGNE